MIEQEAKTVHSNKGINLSVHIKRKLIATILVLAVILQIDKPAISSADANSQVGVRVDYIEELAYITSGTGGSTKFYISLDGMKNWEIIDTGGVVDISAMLSSKENVIYFKGNKDLNPTVVTLQGEDNTLKVSYKVKDGVGRIEYSYSGAVEYRKGSNGTWKTASNLMSTSIYEIKGATLHFRTPATATKRAGKIVTVKISKRPSAPTVKLDGSKLAITGLKSGLTQYRVNDSLNWLTFTSTDKKVNYLDLSSLLGGNTTSNTAIPAGVIELRTLGAEKLTSTVKVIEVPAQAAAPEAVTLNGTTLTILDPDTKKNYEYTIVEKGASYNPYTAKWSASVTSKKAVIIKKVAIGDRVLVRLKSTTDSKTKQVIPASCYKEFTVTAITPEIKK